MQVRMDASTLKTLAHAKLRDHRTAAYLRCAP